MAASRSKHGCPNVWTHAGWPLAQWKCQQVWKGEFRTGFTCNRILTKFYIFDTGYRFPTHIHPKRHPSPAAQGNGNPAGANGVRLNPSSPIEYRAKVILAHVHEHVQRTAIVTDIRYRRSTIDAWKLWPEEPSGQQSRRYQSWWQSHSGVIIFLEQLIFLNITIHFYIRIDRGRSVSTEDLTSAFDHDQFSDDEADPRQWRRVSTIRRSLQYPKARAPQYKSRPTDLPLNIGSVSKIKRDWESNSPSSPFASRKMDFLEPATSNGVKLSVDIESPGMT